MKKNVYFLGIGGIGMSALARYFMQEGLMVGGYDRTETLLTKKLSEEGARIHYDDAPMLILPEFRDPADTLVIYTPAVPADHAELNWFRNNGFDVLKRSQILGHLTDGKYVMAVSGTHGKTTTTTMTAWLNHAVAGEGSAFLGGISKNFDSNFVAGAGNRFAVEADEYDRSFLTLRPDTAVITSTDADHLDIYGTHEKLLEAFGQFAGQIKPGGTLIMHEGVTIPVTNHTISVYRYSYDSEQADFHVRNIALQPDGGYVFDLVCPDAVIEGCRLGIPGRINIENAVAACAMLWAAARHTGNDSKFEPDKIREGLRTFAGVRRRFDFYINTPELIYMDDYAHHPNELKAAIGSVREMFPARKLTVIFQPHLYTRTRDFYREFAESLSMADEVILTPIYPAREEPIEGVDSSLISKLITVPHRIVPLERIAHEVEKSKIDILISFGAGNIENYCGEIAARLKCRLESAAGQEQR